MEIRIKTIRLCNFKGVRTAEYDFGGRNARIEGPNGSGKSTIFDAFTWLLFGKDHRDQTTFELKTIDPATGKPFPREDHWVEAVVTVDGITHTLRRSWSENWVRPAGQIDDVLKGHSSSFYVDGVDVGTKTAYDTAIAAWIKEDTFKLLTSPHYFIDDEFTPWKNRRKAILDLVKDSPERSRVREEFADVVDKLFGRSFEDYRKRIAMEKSANKRDLDNVMTRIAGMRESLPEEVNEASIRSQADGIRAERDRIVGDWRKEIDLLDKAISSADQADAAREAENKAIWAKITAVQLWMSNTIAEAKKSAQEQNNGRSRAIMEAQTAVAGARYAMDGARVREDNSREQLADLERVRGHLATDLQALSENYQAVKGMAFNYNPETICPHCGQEIPASSVEEARARAKDTFLRERKEDLDKIIEKARSVKEEVKKTDARIADHRGIISKAADDYRIAKEEYDKATAEVQRLETIPVISLADIEEAVRQSAPFIAKAKEEMDLRTQAFNTSSRPDDIEELVRQRKDIEEKIRTITEEYNEKLKPLQASLSVNGERKRQLDLIRQKEQEARCFADALASCERAEARAAEFVKADIDSVETDINALFRTARWKMFDRTMDGGIVEMCEVTSPDGVPYRSMNDAMKILCGMDVIRVFSERYGCLAPIFIDNAEGILTSDFGTPAQVIRLIVSDIDKIALINE